MIYEEIKAFEEKHGANQSTYWLFFELLWRDFFTSSPENGEPGCFTDME